MKFQPSDLKGTEAAYIQISPGVENTPQRRLTVNAILVGPLENIILSNIS